MELSERERQIVVLLALGYSNREVAQRLCISHETVSSHLSRIYRRSGAASRLDLAVLAVAHGVVQFDRLVEVAQARAAVNQIVNELEW